MLFPTPKRLRMITFLSFLLYQSNLAIALCTSMGTLQTGAANRTFGILLMVPIFPNVSKVNIIAAVSSSALYQTEVKAIILPRETNNNLVT